MFYPFMYTDHLFMSKISLHKRGDSGQNANNKFVKKFRSELDQTHENSNEFAEETLFTQSIPRFQFFEDPSQEKVLSKYWNSLWFFEYHFNGNFGFRLLQKLLKMCKKWPKETWNYIFRAIRNLALGSDCEKCPHNEISHSFCTCEGSPKAVLLKIPTPFNT